MSGVSNLSAITIQANTSVEPILSHSFKFLKFVKVTQKERKVYFLAVSVLWFELEVWPTKSKSPLIRIKHTLSVGVSVITHLLTDSQLVSIDQRAPRQCKGYISHHSSYISFNPFNFKTKYKILVTNRTCLL